MEVHFPPELEARLNETARASGRRTEELIRDVVAEYLDELVQVRDMLDRRYDDVKSGRVTPISGEEASARLRRLSEDRRAGK